MKEKLTLGLLIDIIGAKAKSDSIELNVPVNKVLTQSVYVTPGDAVIAARWYSAKKTIEEALHKGACAVFCTLSDAKAYNDPRIMIVDEPLECVERFEKWCEKDCHAKRITITGSVGKTTTTGLINTVISKSYNTLIRHSMSNSHGAILRGFQMLKPEHEFWVQEVGGVEPHYIESSAYMLHSDAVVLTNIGTSHLDKYITRNEIFKDKSSLERYAKIDSTVFINYDDSLLKNAEYNHKVVSFAIKDKSADYYAKDIMMTEDGMSFNAVCSEGTYLVKLNLFGEYNAYNALAAIAVGRWADIPMERIISLISTYYPSGMRQNMLNIGGYKLLVDCFNAEPRTVLGSAKTLADMPNEKIGRKIFVTGHIDKLGKDSEKMHTELGHQLSKLNLDIMVFFNGDSLFTYNAVVEDGFKNAYFFDDRDKLNEWIEKNIDRNDVTFYKSGQFAAALVKSIDHVYGTNFQNEQQENEGITKQNDDYIFKLRKDEIAEVIGYTGKDNVLYIPETCDGKRVIRVFRGAFRRQGHIKEVIIPDSVVNIGQEAFYLCSDLKKIKLPLSLKYIGRSAFNCCKSLQNVEIPYGTIHIEMRAFRDCFSLKEITIPETVGFIGEEAFANCNNLVMVCEKGSYAEEYAINKNITYRYGATEGGFEE